MRPEGEAVWERSGYREENNDDDFIHNEFATDFNRERKRRIEKRQNQIN